MNVSIRRVAAGFLIAPLTAALAFACFAPAYGGLPLFERIFRTTVLVASIAYLQTAILALPAYFVLRDRAQPSILNLTLAGATVAAAPWALILMLLPQSGSSWAGRTATMINGIRTPAGWLELGGLIASIAALGALAGVVFWFLAAYQSQPKCTTVGVDDDGRRTG
jgi:hypothetical protein